MKQILEMSEVDVLMTSVIYVHGTDSSGKDQNDAVDPVVEEVVVEFIRDQLVQPVMHACSCGTFRATWTFGNPSYWSTVGSFSSLRISYDSATARRGP